MKFILEQCILNTSQTHGYDWHSSGTFGVRVLLVLSCSVIRFLSALSISRLRLLRDDCGECVAYSWLATYQPTNSL
eukprot:4128875-Amphidinium_carterae.1